MTFAPASSLLGICLKEIKSLIHIDTCETKPLAESFMIYQHHELFYPSIKKNRLNRNQLTWRESPEALLSEEGKTWEHVCMYMCTMFHFCKGQKPTKTQISKQSFKSLYIVSWAWGKNERKNPWLAPLTGYQWGNTSCWQEEEERGGGEGSPVPK